ncbi:hypothetical protein [Streptomyces sp. NPDC020742]|uniref:hypothetical protein n=1 Tax=Streptomyces sp. NPDC020742 TaxID=3154897 RepID=UPI0033E83C04
MRRTTTTLAAASAAALCLGVLLTGCGSTAGRGYVAVGAAGPADGRAPTGPVPPRDGIELTPLDGGRDQNRGTHGNDRGDGTPAPDRTGSATGSAPAPARPSGHDAPETPGSSATPSNPGPAPGSSAPSHGSPSSPGGSGGGSSGGGGSDGPGRPGGSPAPKPPSPTIPPGEGAPAGLVVGRPRLADTDVRWCEKVSVVFLNTGKRPVTAGTVAFGTHIIGGLGVDWATITSTHPLPLPLAPGEEKTGTWRVCVDAWRVPLGMHIDTRDTSFRWK